MLDAFIEGADMAITQRTHDGGDGIGRTVQRARGDDEHPRGLAPISLLYHSLRCGLAPDDPILGQKLMTA
jgi:hypothetical protein